ncbi:MAG: hypothetical protein NXI32_03040 [bacterium]|nr:hypothetical protein [bacterium]
MVSSTPSTFPIHRWTGGRQGSPKKLSQRGPSRGFLSSEKKVRRASRPRVQQAELTAEARHRVANLKAIVPVTIWLAASRIRPASQLPDFQYVQA